MGKDGSVICIDCFFPNVGGKMPNQHQRPCVSIYLGSLLGTYCPVTFRSLHFDLNLVKFGSFGGEILVLKSPDLVWFVAKHLFLILVDCKAPKAMALTRPL